MDDQTGFDPKRRLCPDGTCTGVIGSDGRCGECGRAAGGGNGSAAGAGAARAVAHESAGAPAPNPDGGQFAATAAGGAVSGFDPGRRLCDDGGCVGVVGPDGACTVCGRVAG